MPELRIPILDSQDKLADEVIRQEFVDPGRASQRSFQRDLARFQVTDDPATVTVNSGPDASYNLVYSRGADIATPPADWPIDNGKVMMFGSGASESQYSPTAYGVRTIRFWHDGDAVALYWFTTTNKTFRMFVDGKLNSATGMYTYPASTYLITTLVWPTKKPRFVELQSAAAMHSIFTKKPYKIWKPAPITRPNIFVFGDSYCSPALMASSGNAALSPSQDYNGMWQDMFRSLGVDEILVDGKGGTGYLQTAGGFANYRDRMNAGTYIPAGYVPDVVVFHGGGANDKYNGLTNAAIIAQAVATFTEARAKWPNAKLVFLEGFAPPIFPYRTDYIAIRQGVQAALIAAGIDVYYFDVATTDPMIVGLGNVNAVNADTMNANVYIGGDAAHYTLAGANYLRDRIAVKMRSVLRDTGALVNTLI